MPPSNRSSTRVSRCAANASTLEGPWGSLQWRLCISCLPYQQPHWATTMVVEGSRGVLPYYYPPTRVVEFYLAYYPATRVVTG